MRKKLTIPLSKSTIHAFIGTPRPVVDDQYTNAAEQLQSGPPLPSAVQPATQLVLKAESTTGPVWAIKDDPRRTFVGGLLRRWSLDELPQLWNVLRGDMSLVGPRPPVLYELEHYQEWHKRRLAVRPGLTGLWQVSGRSSVPFDEMVLLDLYYIEHRSAWMDFRIMAKTLPVMLFGSGGY